MKQSLPKISVVTPSFNSVKFIEDCILSVQTQNYPNIEHIVVDGGSSDGTIDILIKYTHLTWISEPDKGQSEALNKGFKMASGDIIAWLNADDVFCDNVFFDVVKFNNDQNWDVLFGDFYLTTEDLKPLRLVRPIPFDAKIFIYYGPYIPSSGSFFKKRIFEEGHLLNINHHFNMDRRFFIELYYAGYKFKYSNKPYSYFRIHENNKSIMAIGDNKKKTIQKSSKRKIEETIIILKKFGISSNNKIVNKIIWKTLRFVYRIKFVLYRMFLLRFSKKF